MGETRDRLLLGRTETCKRRANAVNWLALQPRIRQRWGLPVWVGPRRPGHGIPWWRGVGEWRRGGINVASV